MMMTDRHQTDDDALDMEALDALLAEARALQSPPAPDLVARILADARAADLARHPPRAARRTSALTGLRGLIAALGGWPALGGLSAATLAGLWIGIAPPAALDSVVAQLWGDSVSVTLYPEDDLFGLEA